MRKTLLSLAMLSIFAAASCKKDDKKDDSGKPGILTTGRWQQTGQTYQAIKNGVAGEEVDNYAVMDACDKDNYYTYTTANVLLVNAGAAKCGSEPQEFSAGRWTLMANNTIIRQESIGETTFWHIGILDDHTLQMTVYDTISTTVHVSKLTYTHIK